MRKTEILSKDWKFCETELWTRDVPDLDADGWKTVSVPHDWAINGAFSPDNDPQPLENSVLDYHENMIQIGRTGGLPFIGTGWYVKSLFIPDGYAKYEIEFDGIMNHSKIYVNGVHIGGRPFGYSSFCVDLTPYIRKNEENQLIVQVDSMDKTSRWYPGAGIIRPARLVCKDSVHFTYNGIWVNASYQMTSHLAEITIQTETEESVAEEYQICHQIFNPEGKECWHIKGSEKVCQTQLREPILWDLEQPYLYTLVSSIEKDGQILDRCSTRFGVRLAEFTVDQGFLLNGKQMKIQGVCMHHDNGMLGAAYEESVVWSRLNHLKEMGCNAIRTTHNPPCPRTLDLCDEIGMLVLDEAFDEWTIPKAVNGYANEFPDWYEKDLTDMVKRDRNHPSVILYSVGNEIPDQMYPEGRETCRNLVEICHRLDPYRLVTCGFNRPKAAIDNGLTEEVDVVGMNYCARDYERYRKEHPHWKTIATETMSSVSSRGEFYLPAKVEVPAQKHENQQINSFGMAAVACAYIPDVELDAQRNNRHVAGQFIWSGYDYLGEATPYREEWPSRSSYFGIFDLAGLKKDWYYLMASEWGNKPILHILPHWNWEKGDNVDVFCFSNLDKVELFLNGSPVPMEKREFSRLYFGKIPFVPGELKAIGYRQSGNQMEKVLEDTVKTAGSPTHILLEEEPFNAAEGGIRFINLQITDENGTLCPNADTKVEFKVEGDGHYAASDAGDNTCLRPFAESWCNAFHGKIMIAVRTDKKHGEIMLSAKATEAGLQESSFLLRY